MSIGILVAVLVPRLSIADPPKFLPQGVRATVGTPPAEMQCYDLDGFKNLLRLDTELDGRLRQVELLGNRVDALGIIVTNQDAVITDNAKAIQLLRVENDRVYTLWQNADKQRREAENATHAASWIGWAVATVSTVAAITMGIVLTAK
jgi:hypothetical protein